MKYGFLTVAAAIPSVRVADLHYNLEEIKRLIDEAECQHVEVVVFPELSLTGYTCQDLFRPRTLIDGAEQAMRKDVIAIVGAPVEVGNLLLNCAIVIQQGRILGMVPKTFLPNYSEFYEKRWFASAQDLHDTPLCYAGEDVLLTARRQLFRGRMGTQPAEHRAGSQRGGHHLQSLGLRRVDRQARLPDQPPEAAERTQYLGLCI